MDTNNDLKDVTGVTDFFSIMIYVSSNKYPYSTCVQGK